MRRRQGRHVGYPIALAVLAAVVTLSGCTQFRTIDSSADGRLIQLETGDTLVVRLRGNPSTGASWAFIEPPNPMVLEQVGEMSFVADEEDVCGSPGTFTLRFRAAKSGTTQLNLEYGRAWEDEILEAFSAIVYVR